MGTPNYPKDLASEWNKLRRDVKGAFTSANLRTGMAKIGAKVIEITGQLVLNPGAKLIAKYDNNVDALIVDKGVYLGNPVGRVIIQRYDGTRVLETFGGPGTNGYFSIKDSGQNIIISDDGVTGQGLAKPWLSYNYIETSKLTNPSTVATSSSWVSAYTISGIMQHPRMRIHGGFFASGSDTGRWRVISNGVPIYTANVLGPGFVWVTADMNHDDYQFDNQFTYDIQVMRQSGTGAGVGFTPTYIMGRQS